MYYRLNLFLKSFGVNANPSVSFFTENVKEIKDLLDGYKPVLKEFQLFKYEYEILGNVTIEKRTELKAFDLLNLL